MSNPSKSFLHSNDQQAGQVQKVKKVIQVQYYCKQGGVRLWWTESWCGMMYDGHGSIAEGLAVAGSWALSCGVMPVGWQLVLGAVSGCVVVVVGRDVNELLTNKYTFSDQQPSPHCCGQWVSLHRHHCVIQRVIAITAVLLVVVLFATHGWQQTTSGQLQIVLITGNPWVTQALPVPAPVPTGMGTGHYRYGYSQVVQPSVPLLSRLGLALVWPAVGSSESFSSGLVHWQSFVHWRVVDFDHCRRYRLRSISQVYTSEKMASRLLPLQGKRAARTMQKQQDDGNGHSADEVPSHVRFNDIHESTTTQTGALP
ncbi:hypothetical protein EDB83DRAFT_2326128 [Lactarius deliciosus]|nr:hypothetical protein EDB83DRAFT_2326128 [Lactarius deliciosus]